MSKLALKTQMAVNDIQARVAGEDEGASAVEYGLIVGLIAIGIIVAASTLGDDLTALFTSASTELKTAAVK